MRCAAASKAALSGKALSVLYLLFISQCAAQALSNLPDLSSLSTSLGGGSTSSSDSSTSSSQTSTTTSASTTSSAKSTSASTTDATTSATESASVSLLLQTSTTSDAAATSIFHLSNLPTIAGAANPTQVVPYTANAPFMQKSNMPEGSVFIIVGAILGFFGACVLAWRGMVALSLQRSVKRAALAQHQTFDMKSHAYAPSAGIYGAGAPESSASMEKLAAIQKSNKRQSHRPSTSQGNIPPMYNPLGTAGARGSTQNLFFSPTAGAGLHSHTPTPPASQRPSSAYLPAGYYAAGSSLPAGGAATTHINAHANARGSMLNPLTDRLSGIRAESAGYQRASSYGPSPPESPALAPSPNYLQRVRTDSPGGASSVGGQVGGPTIGGSGLFSQSGSSLNLNVPGGTSTQGGRTPSAYLEDLFENHGSGPRER